MESQLPEIYLVTYRGTSIRILAIDREDAFEQFIDSIARNFEIVKEEG